jgi:hypothetical protein
VEAMNVRQPGKNTIQQQPPQQQPQPNYNPRNNAPQQFNLHPYDQDGPQSKLFYSFSIYITLLSVIEKSVMASLPLPSFIIFKKI